MSAGDWKEMYLAASSGDFELVKYHIRNGVNPNYQHPEILSTALVASIVAGHDQNVATAPLVAKAFFLALLRSFGFASG